MKTTSILFLVGLMSLRSVCANDIPTITALIQNFESAVQANDTTALSTLTDYESAAVETSFLAAVSTNQYGAVTLLASKAPLIVRNPPSFGVGSYLAILPTAAGHLPKTYQITVPDGTHKIRINQDDLPLPTSSDNTPSQIAQARIQARIDDWSNATDSALATKVSAFRDSLTDRLAYAQYAATNHLTLVGDHPTVAEVQTKINQTALLTDAEVKTLALQELNAALAEL